MEKITRVLEKLNQGRTDQLLTLSDLMPLSFAEIRNTGQLSRDEARLLYRAAQKEKQNNLLYTARALTRANPLLRNEMGRARYHGATPYGYDDIIVPRADEFAAPGAVSSMFSPAGYLTELYREARGLHQKDSPRNLDKRRPDLAKLTLSQSNLDDEISTLALSNEQLETALMAKAHTTYKYGYYEKLSASRNSGVTPYHALFEEIREALIQQDFVLPDNVLTKGAGSAAQMALYAGISPELYAILTEKTDGLSAAKREALLKKNFPGINTDSLMDLNALANYYGLPRDEIQALPGSDLIGNKTLLSDIPFGSDLKNTPDIFKENNTRLIKTRNTDNEITVYRLTRINLKDGVDDTHFDYLDLIPQDNNQFCVNFLATRIYSYYKCGLYIGTAYNIDAAISYLPTDLYSDPEKKIVAGKNYSISVTPKKPFPERFTIVVVASTEYGLRSNVCEITITKAPTDILYLNKLLRLAKATGITPLETQHALTRLNPTGKDSDATVLHRFCEFLLYRKRYNISNDDALILSGADIGTVSYDGQLSQFDRMFNNPPLNGTVYSLDGATLDLTADNTDYRIPYLLRAFQITRSDLRPLNDPLHATTKPVTKIINNLEQISKLYLLTLLCGIHGITPAQIARILYNSSYYGIGTIGISDTERRGIINYLWQTTQWLNAQNISADTLYLLQVFQAEHSLTKEMTTFLEALRNGGIDSTSENTLYSTMAPVVAAAMQLESPEMAEVVLRWLDTYTYNNALKTKDIWPIIATETPTDGQKRKLFTWCYALAQRVLLIRTLTLSCAEVQILSADAKPCTVDSLRQISNFHALINRCGEHTGDVLSNLQDKTIRPSELENYSGVPYALIISALKMTSDTYITTWQQLAKLPAYLDIMDTLHILPEEFTSLLTITEKTTPDYNELTTLAGKLQAGLNEQQTQQMQNQLEQRRSEALSGEYRSLVMGKPLANRDDIWRELLVDGKVSAEITTTRLADAIAGIQLYISRTIAGDEPGADSAVLERQFFKEWDIYNKRYSTWAGVSQLVYYPENTIDPTIRIGQTGMMNTMLEQLSQSELNSDTLENAFRQYLTAFEQVANLKVVSGYHDTIDIDEGNTWFIGTSQTEPKKYYWRKVDHSKCQNGRFAANAWSDWKEITCAINPYQDMVRPVIFRSRLYLLWVEEQVRKDAKGEKDISTFSVKLTHIKYDGSWASPFSYDVTDKLKSTSQNPGLYCSANLDDNTLTIACYQKGKDQATTPPDFYFGLSIQQDMTGTDAPKLTDALAIVKSQLDTVSVVKVNTLMSGKYHTAFSLVSQDGNQSLNLSLSLGSYSIDDDYILTFKPNAYITINPDELFHYIGDGIRDYCIADFNYFSDNNNFSIYSPENIKLQPLNSDIPDGDATFTVLKNETSQENCWYLTIAGKTSWNIPENFICNNTKNSTGCILQTDNSWDTHAGYYPYDNSFIAEFYSDATKYTLHPGFTDPIAELNTGKLIKRAESLCADNICIDFIDNDIFQSIKGSDTGMSVPQYPENSTETLLFSFGSLSVKLPSKSHKQTIIVNVSYQGIEPLSASSYYHLTLETPKISESVISLHTTADGAQYMEWDAYRTRLNTLFARQLIEKANNGIEAILSPETQNLREPKPGEGMYVTLTLKPYDQSIHGSDRKFTIMRRIKTEDKDHYAVTDGMLSTTSSTEVRLFIPLLKENRNYILLCARYQSGITEVIRFVPDGNGWQLETNYPHTFPGLESVSGLSQPDEPMDFSGANALYFWELFYYTPMMVAMRLLQEQNFTEANRWISYIWRPSANGAGDWRVRPLKEDTSWNADPLDSVDPDAVAQNDPMHYKVSTLMKLLDLLIARGDSAYRMLERDTLTEAKMWYMQALGLLGDKPLTLISSDWNNPSLSDAADQTKTKQRQDEISRLRSGGLLPEVRTANTLTGLFLPQQNEKLLGYWQTLEMRLFNLRNNLAIDGQPLSLPIFAAPADPAALLSAASAASGGSKALPSADGIPAMRFPQALDSARSLTGQLMQFGSTLQGLIERQDAEAMSELLQNQAGELMLSSLRMQEQALAELDAEKKTLEQSRAGAQSRFDSYRTLYDENVSAAEQRTMDLNLSSAVLSTSVGVLDMAAAAADMAPNVFGMAVGGSRWGGIPKAIGSGIGLAAAATKITADNISQSEAWRRRRQEWEIQKNNADSEVKQIDAQLEALAVRRTATEMQRDHLELQQAQTQAQLEFLQRKFSNKALYSWLRGRLAAIYYRFYDLTAARCMMAEEAYKWQTGEATRYIKPGAWQSSNAGLMAGESLLLNLAEMEQAWLKWDHRALEVTRTVSLAEVYSADKVDLAAKIADLLKGSGSGNTPAATGLSMTTDKRLHAAFNLEALKIAEDYPADLGKTRRIKQISVTLPALVGPYQDVRAVLSYGGSTKLPDGCKAIAVSHGMNDDGQFRLDFNDGHWLPFEGIAVDDNNSLFLSFPGATGDKQKALLLSLSDIIIHIRYTIR
ncbi:neuraminidase-like domain-containing protein [Morganella morganii]|uniref:Tc toxin subunit A-related protein n=1 Tax=Morganella morganii TaxID=582 RepID=UPI00301C15BC